MCYLSQGGKETQLSRTERAQRDKNTRTQHTDSEHKLYLSVCSLDWTDGRTMFSTRLFVCSFVRLLPTCERYTSKTNEPISMQIGINLPPGQGHKRSTSGSGSQRSRSQEAKVMFGSLAETSFSIH